VREFEFVINGENPERSDLLLEGLRCISGECPLENVDTVPIEKNPRYWSKASSWPDERIPEAGEDVEILPGWNMVLDVADPPMIEMLTINGRLSFAQGDYDIHLRAKHIFVRSGEFLIGSARQPFEREAKITLIGEQDSETIVMSGAVEAGNKVLVNVGKVEFYGKERSRWSRLLATVNKNDREATVEAGLDWAAGDQLYFAPTAL
jgi:hypothetical protein